MIQGNLLFADESELAPLKQLAEEYVSEQERHFRKIEAKFKKRFPTDERLNKAFDEILNKEAEKRIYAMWFKLFIAMW
jgi:hypothetical protein